MPNMSTSHGAVLYYVVKIPKAESVTPINRRASSYLLLDEKSATSTPLVSYHYQKIENMDSGWDNPFRPDGNLSKEADEIVELIKEGKPITPTQSNASPKLSSNDVNGDVVVHRDEKGELGNAVGLKANGSLINNDGIIPTSVEVQLGTTAVPTDASEVEHVVLKKKPRCKCCVIQ